MEYLTVEYSSAIHLELYLVISAFPAGENIEDRWVEDISNKTKNNNKIFWQQLMSKKVISSHRRIITSVENVGARLCNWGWEMASSIFSHKPMCDTEMRSPGSIWSTDVSVEYYLCSGLSFNFNNNLMFLYCVHLA